MHTARSLVAAFGVLALGALISCSSDPTASSDTGTSFGKLSVSTSTTGTPTDTLSYLLYVDSEQPHTIESPSSVVSVDIASGNHVLRLGGISTNCSVAGENPRTVAIIAGQSSSVVFKVTCAEIPHDVEPTILFLSRRRDIDGLYTVQWDGTQLRRLTEGESQYAASWSPDGSRIAFISYSEAKGGRVSVMNADGTGLTELGRTGWSTPPAWSPDGRSIAYFDMDGTGSGAPQLSVIPSSGGSKLQLTHGAMVEPSASADPSSPIWSPDGTRLLFARYYPAGQILSITSDGMTEDTISTPPPGQYDRDPRWSPDGSKVAFIRVVPDTLEEDYVSNLWVMNADGSGAVQLTDNSLDGFRGYVNGFTWAGDSNGLAVSELGGLFRIEADGSGRTKLFDGTPMQTIPLWSPDRNRIVFGFFTGELIGAYSNIDLSVMNADGSNLRNITSDNHGPDLPIAWRPVLPKGFIVAVVGDSLRYFVGAPFSFQISTSIFHDPSDCFLFTVTHFPSIALGAPLGVSRNVPVA